MEKRRNCSYGAFFPLFHNILNISLNSRVQLHYIFVKCGCANYFFLNSANLICRGKDISKYFRESLGIRDNKSRLYVYPLRKHVYSNILKISQPNVLTEIRKMM